MRALRPLCSRAAGNDGGDPGGVEAAFMAEMRTTLRASSRHAANLTCSLHVTRSPAASGCERLPVAPPGHGQITRKTSMALCPAWSRCSVGLLSRMVFDDALSPRVHMRQITATELMAYFEVYTDLFEREQELPAGPYHAGRRHRPITGTPTTWPLPSIASAWTV